MFIEVSVVYVAKNGIPWRALPDEFGNWSAVYNRLKRWKNNGTWEKLWYQLETDMAFIPIVGVYIAVS